MLSNPPAPDFLHNMSASTNEIRSSLRQVSSSQQQFKQQILFICWVKDSLKEKAVLPQFSITPHRLEEYPSYKLRKRPAVATQERGNIEILQSSAHVMGWLQLLQLSWWTPKNCSDWKRLTDPMIFTAHAQGWSTKYYHADSTSQYSSFHHVYIHFYIKLYQGPLTKISNTMHGVHTNRQ